MIYLISDRYKQECGLVFTSFNGYIEIYDSLNLQLIWNNANIIVDGKASKFTSITSMDYSKSLDL